MGWFNNIIFGSLAATAGGAYLGYKYRDELGDAIKGDPNSKNYSGLVLKYPIDVENLNGHYVIFNIYERGAPDFEIDNKDLNIYYNSAFNSERTFDADTTLGSTVEGFLEKKGIDTSFLQGNPVNLIKDAIVLYMPENVGVKYSTEYEAASIGGIGKLAAGIGDYMKNNMSGSEAALSGLAQAMKTIEPIIQFGTLGGAEGLGALVQQKTGIAAGDVTEMTFKGLNYRDFTFTFSLTPKSQKEAMMVKAICDTFTYHMLPEKIGRGAALAYRVPGQFTMRYMFRGKTNNYLHKQTFMVLKDVEIKYGEGKFRAYRADGVGAPPLHTTIQLTFTETELIDRRRFKEGTYAAAEPKHYKYNK